MADQPYLMAGQLSELDRLQLQSRVWEPAGRALLDEISPPLSGVALDAGCGALGWLRILSRWAGAAGRVVGTDTAEALLQAAKAFATAEGLENVTLQADDLFASALAPASFDLVHARYMLAPIGRPEEQMTAYARLARPGGWLVVEEPDSSTWHLNPRAPATERLIELILTAFRAGGGDFDAGRTLRGRFEAVGVAATLKAHTLVLEPGHPYLRLPLQFATSLAPRMASLIDEDALAVLRAEVESELATPGRWGTTFTLIQAVGRSPS